jgi:peptide/nickel transport system ATP-binding protein
MTEPRSSAIIETTGLSVTFPTREGDVRAVRDLSFGLERGETIGIVGESGSGKSTVALAILGLLPKYAKVTGSVRCMGNELIGLREEDLAKIRSSVIAYIPQDPLSSLNPAFTVGWQIAETIWTRRNVSKEEAHRRAVELLDMVGIPKAAERADSFPHEFSGGMRQRVVIAIAMANDPDVMIADEPTTALDVTIQAQVLEALRTAQKQTQASLILITHDLGVVAGMADRIMVMYAGKPVETGSADTIFYQSKMPYTLGLLGSLPRMDARDRTLRPIPGNPPSLLNVPPGCPFAPRCTIVIQRCVPEEPPLASVGSDHLAACHRSRELTGGATGLFAPTWTDVEVSEAEAARAADELAADAGAGDGARAANETLVEIRDLVKNFPIRGGGLIRHTVGEAQAVSGISFDLTEGETLGLVGESGSGKSTTARAVLQLLPPTSGSVRYLGTELAGQSRKQLRPMRQHLQMVFQDPFASLDPRMPVGEIVAEPLRVHGRWDRKTGPERVDRLFELVGLNPEHRNRFPHEFSGGQRQRVGIARALALDPKVLVLDEPVSALDVSIQAGIVNLLEELQDRLGLAYLFIAHDLSVVRHISDRVAVMYLGKIVEIGMSEQVYETPSHPYTQALLSAVPVPDPAVERRRRRILLTGDVPSAVLPPSGCRFRTRCWKAREICAVEEPALVDRGQGHPSACHFAETASVVPGQ